MNCSMRLSSADTRAATSLEAYLGNGPPGCTRSEPWGALRRPDRDRETAPSPAGDYAAGHGWQAQAAPLSDLPQTPTMALQELPAGDLQALLPRARLGCAARRPSRSPRGYRPALPLPAPDRTRIPRRRPRPRRSP
jgi:hypothetical protein